MNKKFKSIFVLSVLLLSLVGATALSANETSTDITSTEDSLTPVSTTDSNVTSDENQSTENTDTTEETVNNITPDTQNTTSPNETLIEGYSNDDVLEFMAYGLALGTDSEIYKLVNALNIIDSEKYAKLVSMLENNQQYSALDFYDALKELDFASQKEILNLMQAIDEENGEEYTIPYNTNKANTNNVKSSSDNTVQSSSDDSVKSYVNPVSSINKEATKKPATIDDKDEIFLYYLALYIEGRITYDEFINILEEAGFDTSKITLNEDGSITYDGITSDVPINKNSTDDNIELYHHNLALYEEGKLTYEEFINILNQSGFDTTKITLNDDGSVTYGNETSGIPVSPDENRTTDSNTDTTDSNTDSTDSNTDSNTSNDATADNL